MTNRSLDPPWSPSRLKVSHCDCMLGRCHCFVCLRCWCLVGVHIVIACQYDVLLMNDSHNHLCQALQPLPAPPPAPPPASAPVPAPAPAPCWFVRYDWPDFMKRELWYKTPLIYNQQTIGTCRAVEPAYVRSLMKETYKEALGMVLCKGSVTIKRWLFTGVWPNWVVLSHWHDDCWQFTDLLKSSLLCDVCFVQCWYDDKLNLLTGVQEGIWLALKS